MPPDRHGPSIRHSVLSLVAGLVSGCAEGGFTQAEFLAAASSEQSGQEKMAEVESPDPEASGPGDPMAQEVSPVLGPLGDTDPVSPLDIDGVPSMEIPQGGEVLAEGVDAGVAEEPSVIMPQPEDEEIEPTQPSVEPTQMLSATNLVSNGDFSGGTTGWGGNDEDWMIGPPTLEDGMGCRKPGLVGWEGSGGMTLAVGRYTLSYRLVTNTAAREVEVKVAPVEEPWTPVLFVQQYPALGAVDMVLSHDFAVTRTSAGIGLAFLAEAGKICVDDVTVVKVD